MGFRQKKHENKEWTQWLKQHADLIEASGLPDLVVSDEEHWHEFIEHGQLLHSGEAAAQFNVDWLTLRQKAATLRLIRTRPLLHPYEVEMGLVEEMIRAVERLAPEQFAMNDNSQTSPDEPLPEYDFSQGERGKYAAHAAKGTNIVVLDADVAAAFPDAQSVNDALRALVQVARRAAKVG